MLTFDLRSQATIDAAERTFSRRGYGNANMREIAAEADLSIAGLYYYLPSKAAALRIVCKRALLAMMHGFDLALNSASAPEARLRLFIQHHVTFVVRNAHAYRVLLRDIDSLEGEDHTFIFGLRRSYFEQVTDLVIAVQQERRSGTSTHVATAALFGMMNWIPMWLRESDEKRASQIANELSNVFLFGLCESAELTQVAS